MAGPESLREAVRYALLGGGKRLRPALAWQCCAAAGSPGERSLPAGAAVELVHAFSLVHDDLPAMDNDDLRRGRPTLHIHAGEAMAILAGDAMLALAFDVIARESPSAATAAALAGELTQATLGMIGGQVYDTLAGLPEGLSERERLELIHRSKTGALIRASCRMGVLISGHVEALDPMTAYADAVGLMFQIVDDLLDEEGTAEQTGKRTRKDRDAGKLTFPGALGVEASRREVDRLLEAAVDAVAAFGPEAEPLRDLARLMANRRH